MLNWFYRWSRDNAVEYMLNHTILSRDQAEKEVDRYITWPAQACAYKIGELKILELRHKAQDTLGNCVLAIGASMHRVY